MITVLMRNVLLMIHFYFTVIYYGTVATDQLNRDLKVVTDWTYQWKMQFKPDINKQDVQVIFSQ